MTVLTSLPCCKFFKRCLLLCSRDSDEYSSLSCLQGDLLVSSLFYNSKGKDVKYALSFRWFVVVFPSIDSNRLSSLWSSESLEVILHIHVKSTNSLFVEGFMLSNALVVTDG